MKILRVDVVQLNKPLRSGRRVAYRLLDGEGGHERIRYATFEYDTGLAISYNIKLNSSQLEEMVKAANCGGEKAGLALMPSGAECRLGQAA